MRHRLEPSIEIRIRMLSEELMKKEFRDWSRIARVQIRHRKQKVPRPRPGARLLCKISPIEQGSDRVDESPSTGGRDRYFNEGKSIFPSK
jgi:hypothetical protein